MKQMYREHQTNCTYKTSEDMSPSKTPIAAIVRLPELPLHQDGASRKRRGERLLRKETTPSVFQH